MQNSISIYAWEVPEQSHSLQGKGSHIDSILGFKHISCTFPLVQKVEFFQKNFLSKNKLCNYIPPWETPASHSIFPEYRRSNLLACSWVTPNA
jgi:hypothetical protein